MSHAHGVLERHQSAGGLRIGEDVVFDGGRDADLMPLVQERGLGDGASQPRRPSAARAPRDQRAGAVVAGQAAEGGCRVGVVADMEVVLTVTAVETQSDLQALGDAAGAQVGEDAEVVDRLLRAVVPVHADAEHPIIPRIVNGGGRLPRCRGAVGHVHAGRQRRERREPHQAQLQHPRQAAADLIARLRRVGHVVQRVRRAAELFQPDESDRVGIAAPACHLRGDEDVDVGVLPVPHPVHKHDLCAHEVEITPPIEIGTVEEDAERRVLDAAARVRRSLRTEGNGDERQAEAESETHEGRSHVAILTEGSSISCRQPAKEFAPRQPGR